MFFLLNTLLTSPHKQIIFSLFLKRGHTVSRFFSINLTSPRDMVTSSFHTIVLRMGCIYKARVSSGVINKRKHLEEYAQQIQPEYIQFSPSICDKSILLEFDPSYLWVWQDDDAIFCSAATPGLPLTQSLNFHLLWIKMCLFHSVFFQQCIKRADLAVWAIISVTSTSLEPALFAVRFITITCLAT